MNDKEVLKLLKKNPMSREELIVMFPERKVIMNQILTSLIISGKVLLKGNQYLSAKKANKMHNKKVEIDGIWFDSIKEGNRYLDLKILIKAGKISDLKLQPKFKIIAGIYWAGKRLRTRYYIADFQYIENGIDIVEDVKSEFTVKEKVYTIKRQLFVLNYPEYEFREYL